MFTRTSRTLRRRRGMILMVVLALLTLFAIVGVSFVYVANSQETSARIFRESEIHFKPDVDPEAAFSYALGQILYDCNDDETGIYSGLRGHSLARNAFGWDSTKLNDKPFTGVGRLNYVHPNYAGETNVKDLLFVNYTYFNVEDDDKDKIRDPERYPIEYRTLDSNGKPVAIDSSKQPYVPMGAVPYTYPDHNNYFLAAIDPATGKIACPSFHRGYLFPLDNPSDPLWTSKVGKYRTVRPTNNYHTNFPKPIDKGGDVKNLDGVPGGADSVWIDIGAPVMRSADGRKYKMLVAPLILDLDGRLDLNVIGNLMGWDTDNSNVVQTHRSNQGWGPWEINPAKVLNQDNSEWRNVFIGSKTSGLSRYPGRYDTNNDPPNMGDEDRQRVPLGPKLAGGGYARGWAQVDFNGANDEGTKDDTLGRASDLYTLPSLGSGPYFGFPTFPSTGGYRNGAPPAGANWTANENSNHASIFWPFHPRAGTSPDKGSNRRFPVSDLARVLLDGSTGADMLASDLRGLLKGNLWTGGKRRNLVTLLSADFNRPGATPYVWSRLATGTTDGATDSAKTRYGLTNTGATWADSTGNFLQNVPFPDPSTFRTQTAPTDSEFDAGTWKHSLTIKDYGQIRQRISLDRDLPAYPTPNADGAIDLSDMTTKETYDKAVAARQTFADDLWKVLRSVTGASDPNTLADTMSNPPGPGTSSQEFHALRALAQLAVNIVDYVDNDDVMTEFSFTYTDNGQSKTERFYGFELPRLVINEVYVQYDNENDSVDMNGNLDQSKNYLLNTWVELMNPLYDDTSIRGTATPSLDKDTTARLRGKDSNGHYPIYRIILTEASDAADDPLLKPDNTTGDPLFGLMDPNKSTHSDWENKDAPMDTFDVITPMPSTNRFDDPDLKNTGFFLVGPKTTFKDPEDGDEEKTNPKFKDKYTSMLFSEDMRLKIPIMSDNADEPRPRIVLQRLANPTLKEQPDPTMANYNPFITVDYVEDLKDFVQDGRLYDEDGERANVTPMNERVSAGRTQPYAANKLQWIKTVVDEDATDEPSTTFYRQNSKTKTANELNNQKNFPKADDSHETNLKLPFDWLIHLDRKVINPLELLHVSGVAPHRVTQLFVQKAGLVENEETVNMSKFYDSVPANQHAAPWGDPKMRLYRFFEFVTMPPLYSFDNNNPVHRPMDRVMGKINLNAVWNRDVFRALADAQKSNVFYDADDTNHDKLVDELFDRLMASRSGKATGTNGDYVPDLRPTDKNLADALEKPYSDTTEPLDRPFWSFAIGQGASDNNNVVFAGRKASDGSAASTGIEDTLFRSGLFDVQDPPQDKWTPSPDGAFKPKYNPYQKKELLRKIFNNVTTRSNVFAVWITVGFFKVEDDSVQPAKLGEEIGKSENRHVRYRMFAIVDRTQMKAFETTSTDDFSSFNAGDEREVKLNFSTAQEDQDKFRVEDPRTGRKWEVKDDVYLTYQPNTDNEETVRVYLSNNKPHARFQRSHPNNCRVICRGNPGPMSRYDPRSDNEVVPFFMLIE